VESSSPCCGWSPAGPGDTPRGDGDWPGGQASSWGQRSSRSRNGMGAGRRFCPGRTWRDRRDETPRRLPAPQTVPRPRFSEAAWMLGQTLAGPVRDAVVLNYLGQAPTRAGRVDCGGLLRRGIQSDGPWLSRDADPFPHPGRAPWGTCGPLTALSEDGVRAVYVRGGMTGSNRLAHKYLLLRPAQFDPRTRTAGDLCDVGGGAGPSAVAHGGPGRRASNRGLSPSRRPGSWNRPDRHNAEWTPEPAFSSKRAMRPASGRPSPHWLWGRCWRKRPEAGP